MSVDVIRSDDSIRDVQTIVGYYADQQTPATGLKFARAVDKTLNLLAIFPEMGPDWESEKT